MKNILLLILWGLACLPCSRVSAEQIKIKYVGSIYTDTAGVSLKHPAGVNISGDTLLVADSGGKRILSFRFNDDVATPDKSYSVPDMYPLMVQKARNGDFYVLDGRERQIVVLDKSGKLKGDLQMTGLPEAKRIVPRSFKVDAAGRILILDIFTERVLVLDDTGLYQRQIEFPDNYGAFSDLAIDAKGNIFLLDSVAGALYKATPEGVSFFLWSHGLKEYMNFPASMDTDGRGSIFLIDKHGSGLAIVGPDGSFLGRKLGMGWTDGQLYYPNQISINSSGNIFIADTENHRIQQFNIED